MKRTEISVSRAEFESAYDILRKAGKLTQPDSDVAHSGRASIILCGFALVPLKALDNPPFASVADAGHRLMARAIEEGE